MKDVEISAVIPVLDEGKNIKGLHEELKKVLVSLNTSFEIIYVNDGSRDDTLGELKKIPDIQIINLLRNYGQATALDAGFKRSKGKIIISIDGDGQNDSSDIPLLIHHLKNSNVDVVSGRRNKRMDSASVRLLSRAGMLFRKAILSDTISDPGCTLRVYKREAVDSLDLGGEMHRYIIALLKWKGFKVLEVEVNHRERKFGQSKYSNSKAIRAFIDLLYIWFISKYHQRPLHLFGYMSIVSFCMAVVSAGWATYEKVFFDLSLNRNAWFFLCILFLLSTILFFSFGIIIDFLIRIYLNTSGQEKRYYIRETIKT